MTPAMAVPVNEDCFDVVVDRPFGRFCKERREIMGFGLEAAGLTFLGELMLKHLALSMAIDAIVAAMNRRFL